MKNLTRNTLILTLLSSSGLCLAQAQPDTSDRDGGNQRYAVIATPTKHVRAELTVVVDAPRLSAREWIICAASLPELPGQTEVHSALFPEGQPGREPGAEGRPILFSRLPVKGSKWRHGLTIRVEYDAVLKARHLVRRGSEPPTSSVLPLDAATRRNALARGNEFDFESPGFQRWLDKHALRRDVGEGEIDFARRVFLAVKNGFRYRFVNGMDRLASHTCQSGESDCGGLAIVFVSALRASGIPARALSGRWAFSSDKEPTHQAHVKAEFFTRGVGWVPADLSSAVLFDRSPEGVRDFGHDPGDFLTMHVGTSLVLDTIHFGRETVEWLQGPSYWMTGSGSLDGLTRTENWKVKAEALDVREAVLRKPTGAAATPKEGNGKSGRVRP